SNQVVASLTPHSGNANALDLNITNTGTLALTPGVANGISFGGTFTNPLGAVLPAIQVSNGASLGGPIVNQGSIGTTGATAVSIANSTVMAGITNSGLIAGSARTGGASFGVTVTGGVFGGSIVNQAGGVIGGGVADPVLGLFQATGTAFKSTVPI